MAAHNTQCSAGCCCWVVLVWSSCTHFTPELAHTSIRFGVGRFTTEEEIAYAVDHLKTKVSKLREMSPLWEMYKDGVDLKSVQWAAH